MASKGVFQTHAMCERSRCTRLSETKMILVEGSTAGDI